MINKMSIYVVFALFLSTMYAVYFIKERVVLMKSELSEVRRQIRIERDSIHILRAELTYLSAPERLSKLNDNYLKLYATTSQQIVAGATDATIYEIEEQKNAKRLLAASISNSNVKWRFKKGPEKYLTRVSGRE